MRKYDVEEYVDTVGRMPFREWLLSLKDTVARAKLTARVDRASFGNFGDWKAVRGATGIFEMREHYGPGYRIFYSVVDQKIVLLLAGSMKRDQKKAISLAKQRLADYKKRNSDDESETK
jgi:putative addiction module killer protein